MPDSLDVQSVLFFVPYGQWQVHNQLDALVAAAAESRGLSVHIITCDGLFDPCAITRGVRNCADCRAGVESTLSTFRLSGRTLGSLLLENDVTEADAWVASLAEGNFVDAVFGDLPIGEWATPSVMTHFRVGLVEQLAEPRIRLVHRRFLRDTLLTFRILERVLESQRIDALFLFNARFYPYRAAFEAAKRRRVRILVHERGRVADSFSFFDDEICLSTQPVRRLARSWSTVPLKAVEIDQLRSHFDGKLAGESGHWPAFYGAVREADVYTVLDIPRGARLVGFFTSSSDELAHFEHYGNARRQFELIDNVALALLDSNVVLVVRHHPAISGRSAGVVEVSGFDQAYKQALRRHANVRILMPSDDISSYALFPHLTAAIAPFSSIAMETLAYGIPTLVAEVSDAAFSQRYILPDWSSFTSIKETMHRMVSDQSLLEADDLRAFYRLCYSVLFRFSIRFKAIGIENYFEPSLRLPVSDAVLSGYDPALDRVLDYLRDGASVHRHPDEGDGRGSATAEDDFIVDQLRIFKERRHRRETLRTLEAEPECVPTFTTLIDVGVGRSLLPQLWSTLPHASTITVHTFGSNWMRISRLKIPHLLWRWWTATLFRRWRRQLLWVLKQCSGGYVLVTSGRFQLHDTSLPIIAQTVAAARTVDQPVVAISGWIRDPAVFEPVLMDVSRTDLDAWCALCRRLPDTLRIQDVVSLVVVRCDWLATHLRAQPSAEALASVIIDEAAKARDRVTVAQPVFLMH
jgi:hypothetical protein